jgi:GTP cyclohydrolase III
MKFSDYLNEADAETSELQDRVGMRDDVEGVKDDGAQAVPGHVDVEDETTEAQGDIYDGYQNIQNVVHILAEFDHMEDGLDDAKVKLNEILQNVADDLEDLLESVEKDEDKDSTEDSDESDESEDGDQDSNDDDEDEDEK